MRKLKKLNRKKVLISVLVLVAIVSFATPTLSRFANQWALPGNLPVWDGSIAESYNSGTGSKDDPYMITSGAEFAYFAEELKSTDYSGVYFKLGNDIILNNGYFVYENSGVKYMSLEEEYYIKKYTNEVYTDKEYSASSEVVVNSFEGSIENFKGNLDGSFYSIYGMYITSASNESLALFDNLSGTIENIFIENMLVLGKDNVAGLAINSSDSKIEDVFINGYAVSSGAVENKTDVKKHENINLTTGLEERTIKIFDNSYLNEDIISSSISGDYVVSDKEELNYEIKINDISVPLGAFSVDLGNTQINETTLYIGADTKERNISLINLEYETVYKLSSSSGLLNTAKNTDIRNVVTDVKVDNIISSSGFIGNVTGDVSIKNSYNTGSVSGDVYSNAIVGSVSKGTVTIDNTYNSGTLVNESSFIGTVNEDSVVTVSNSFNKSDGVIVLNNYEDTTLENVYNSSTEENENILLLDTTFTRENFDSLMFGDFNKVVDKTEDVWVYNENLLPELYFVNEVNLVDIRIGSKSWNKLASNNDFVYYNDEITVAVTSSAYVYTLENVEYFISYEDINYDETMLEAASWLPYEASLKLSDEGAYTVYVKLTTYSGDIKYMSTDRIVIDKNAPTASLEFSGNVWDSYRKDVTEIYMEDNADFKITATDENSGIDEISYYLSNDTMSKDELSNLNEASWINYTGDFSISPVGNNILYARAMDRSGNISFLNSDMITFEGYFLNSIDAGLNGAYTVGDILNVTSNSSVRLNYLYNIPTESLPAIRHTINFNKQLPGGTVIIITDNITGSKYDYKIKSSDGESIMFTQFNKLGTKGEYYAERDYDNGTNIVENFTITINFDAALMTSHLTDIRVWLEAIDASDTAIRETAASSVKPFNVYHNTDASMFIGSATSSVYLKYNSDSITNINVNTGVTYKANGSYNIFDTFIEEQDIYLKFKLYDDYDETVPRAKLNNLILKIDGESYYPNENGEFIVNLNTGIQEINKNIELHAYKTDSFLEEGRYNLVMTSYISYTEHMGNYLAEDSIPLTVTKSAESSNYSFRAIINNDPILNSENETEIINISSAVTGLTTSNVRISLYKKDEFNAASQTYSLINLNDYIVGSLDTTSEANKYLVDSNNFNFELDLTSLEKQGYKFIIDSYDGDTLISSIEKNFVVK